MTSNNNVALHHVLFQMVKNTEQVSNTVMRLGAALAVIRYKLDTAVFVSCLSYFKSQLVMTRLTYSPFLMTNVALRICMQVLR